MGNDQSAPTSKSRRSSKKSKDPETATDTVKCALGDISASLQTSMKKFEESSLLDTVCGTLMDDDKLRSGRSSSYAYSEDYSEEDSRTISEDETLDEYDRRRKTGKKDVRSESESLVSDSLSDASKKKSKKGRASEDSASFISEDSSFSAKKGGKGVVTETTPDTGLSKPLASSFAKRCYFTKAGIGKTTQHYEGLTLTGNVVLMLASAMKLKGCPTICDEDLRRVEQTYPNQFSRLPDELLLSSGWRRISKYCHFSNNPIPDGVPFFHSKSRIHPSGGYYFLLAAAVGMTRPIEVEPLTRDTLVLLETDYPTQCDAAPNFLIEDPTQWTLVEKFCFFSGGPINTDEDVFYQADFGGNLIFMLAFLSPSLTPEELYKLGPAYQDLPGLKSMAAVEEVESVYDLTERDFDDLKLYHLGPCRALPPYILQPTAWTKVLPPHFLAAKQQAMMKAHDYEQTHGIPSPATAGATIESNMAAVGTISTATLKQGDQLSFNFEAQNMAARPENHEHYNHGYAPSGAGSSYQEPNTPPMHGGYYPQDRGAESVDLSYASPHPYPPGQHGPQGYGYGPYGPSPRSEQFDDVEQSFQREVEEEGAFIDSSAPIDEAIASRERSRTTKPLILGPRGPGHAAMSPPGYFAGSDTGSSQIDPPAEPPSLSKWEDVPDDEGGSYMESSPQSEYSSDQHLYDANGGEMRNPADALNGYYHDGEYYQAQKASGDSSDYYEGEEEYYDSPEKGNNRVHTALEQQVHLGPPSAGTQQASQFIYSPDDAEFSEGYRREEAFDTPDEGQYYRREEAFDTPDEGQYYDSHKHHNGDPTLSTTEVESFESADYNEGSRAFAEEETENFVPTEAPSSNVRKAFSPRSETSYADSASISEYSQTSAMRGAQELLKKNRQKRLEMAMRKHKEITDPGDEIMSSPQTKYGEEDISTSTSMVSGSSVWTDMSQDRSSRRALILQMAKARMKSNKMSATLEDKMATPIEEEEPNEETKSESVNASIDLAVDLD